MASFWERLHNAIEELPGVGNVVNTGEQLTGYVSAQEAVYMKIKRIRTFGISAAAIMGVLQGGAVVKAAAAGGAALISTKGVQDFTKNFDTDAKAWIMSWPTAYALAVETGLGYLMPGV
jgi:hypothetical protein